MSSYPIQLISPEEKEFFFKKYESKMLYTSKIDIYGCCIKLLTESGEVKNKWEDNFYSMSESVRSHGRLIVMYPPGEPLHVKYDPYTKTAFLINVDYYGWIKSVALAVASDILEDEHRIYSVHGAAIDVGIGISIIAPSNTGKSTHTWGLLQLPNARLISDDWYFVRLSNREPLVFSSEKNWYIDAADIGKIWKEFENLSEMAHRDQKGRAIVNARWVVGAGGVIPMGTIQKIILLKRDAADKNIAAHCTSNEALTFLLEHNFCNPHQLVKDERKIALRTSFFRNYLEKADIYLVNTAGTPQDTQNEIQKIIFNKK